MASLSDTKNLVIGDMVIWETNHIYTRESGKVTNDETTGGTAGAVTLLEPIGQPVKLSSGTWQFASAANVTSSAIHGIIIDGPAIPATDTLAINTASDGTYTILARGPSIINEANIPSADAYGDAITASEYVTAVEALNIQTLPISATVSEQTT